MIVFYKGLYSEEAPHSEEGSPAGVACNPRYARVKSLMIIIKSPADDQHPPRQEGKAGASPCLGQVRDGAGVGVREQLHT